MDEDHNQDTGFVTDEVNQVIKVSFISLIISRSSEISKELKNELVARNLSKKSSLYFLLENFCIFEREAKN